MAPSARLLALSVMLPLAACVPNLGDKPVPRAASSLAAQRSLPDQGGHWPGDGWWKAYGDPQLAELIDDVAGLVAALGEQDAMIVGTDIGGLLAWSVATFNPHVVRRLVVIAAPHPLRLRRAVVTDPLRQGRAVKRVWSTFQLPRWPERLLKDRGYVRELFQDWSGAHWRASVDYVDIVEHYAGSMQVSQVAHSALEIFRWSVRSVPRTDGRRAIRALRSGVQVPVLQLHGEDDPWLLLSTAHGSGRYVRAPYVFTTLAGVGHFPSEEAPERVSRELIRWARK